MEKIEGNGVGLAILKRIVDQHQGKIWVEIVLGESSTFYVSFNISVAFQVNTNQNDL